MGPRIVSTRNLKIIFWLLKAVGGVKCRPSSCFRYVWQKCLFWFFLGESKWLCRGVDIPSGMKRAGSLGYFKQAKYSNNIYSEMNPLEIGDRLLCTLHMPFLTYLRFQAISLKNSHWTVLSSLILCKITLNTTILSMAVVDKRMPPCLAPFTYGRVNSEA